MPTLYNPHRNPGTPYQRYFDYQASPQGEDVSSDVRDSRICFVFGVDRTSSSGELYEQMEVVESQERENEPMEWQDVPERNEPMDWQDVPGGSEPSRDETERKNGGFYDGRFHDELK